MAADEDFVLTISDDDEEIWSDANGSKIEPAPPEANIGRKRKRGLESQVADDENSRKIKKTRLPHVTRALHDKRVGQEEQGSENEDQQGQHDETINPDFEFDLGPNHPMNSTEDFDGWDLAGRSSSKAEKGAKGVKKAIDIDDIIARRASNKHKSGDKSLNDISETASANGLESEKALEVGGYEDEDEHDGGAGFPDFGDDELLATDGFGAGAAPEDDEAENAEEDQSSKADVSKLRLALARGQLDTADSDSGSVASPVAHPDDMESVDDGTASIASVEDVAEAAKRAAFFAPEDLLPEPKKKAIVPSESNSFQQFSLSRPLIRGVAALSFSSPTPIQKRTIPIALAGKDVVGSAVTGSGKTAAFLLPILERLLYRPKKVPTTRVAILLPTRELAVQCYNVATQLSQYTDITFAQLVGGFSVREQEVLLKKRPDVVIATPGRFIDHMRNSASFVVENLEILVLDEADRMLEDGFADELDEILQAIPKGRQTMLFSATMTESVDKLVRVGMNRPVRVSVDAQKATVEGLVQEFVRLRPGREDKRMASLLLLCTKVYDERVIVFFRQKKEVHRARIIFGLLGLKAGELHGAMSQEQRINAVASFRSGRTTHLLATDLASRGLDIKNVLTVINFEAPQSHEIYLHRVGRTARAGQPGRASTIAAEPDRKVVKAAVKSARAQGAKVVSRNLVLTDVDSMDSNLRDMEAEIEEILREEQEEKQLAQADMQLTRGENLVKHDKEIMARPKRTWFESEKEKRISKKAGRAELNGPESVAGKKQKLSGKDKKRLDDRRERTEGKVWRKGKGSEEVAKAERRESKARKGSKGVSKRPNGKRPQKR